MDVLPLAQVFPVPRTSSTSPTTPTTSTTPTTPTTSALPVLQPGDVISAVVTRAMPQGSIVMMQGVEVMLNLAALPVNTELLLQVQTATDGLLLEILSQQQPALNPASPLEPMAVAPDEFISSQDSQTTQDARHTDSASTSKSAATASKDAGAVPATTPAMDSSSQTTTPTSSFPIQLGNDEFNMIATRLNLPNTPVVRVTMEALLSHQLPVNAESVTDIMVAAQRLQTPDKGAHPEVDTLRQVLQSIRGEASSPTNPLQTATATITPEATQAIRGAVLAMKTELPFSQPIINALHHKVILQIPLQQDVQAISQSLQGLQTQLQAQPEFAATAIQPLQQAQQQIQQLYQELAALTAQTTATVYPESVRVLQVGQQALQTLTAQILQSDPLLVQLNVIVETILEAVPGADASTPEAQAGKGSALAIKTLDQWLDVPRETLPQVIREYVTAQNPDTMIATKDILSVLARTLDLERHHIEEHEVMQSVQDSHTQMRGSLDRLHVVRMLQLTPQTAEAQIQYLEIPIAIAQEQSTALLKLYRRKSKSSSKDKPEEQFTVALRIELDNVQEVTSLLTWLANTLSVVFTVQSETLRRHFSAYTETLQEALRRVGFEADIQIQVDAKRTDMFEEFQAPPSVPARNQILDTEA